MTEQQKYPLVELQEWDYGHKWAVLWSEKEYSYMPDEHTARLCARAAARIAELERTLADLRDHVEISVERALRGEVKP